jgi:hypothetical protein
LDQKVLNDRNSKQKMNLEARVQNLERRMDAYESTTTKQSKRKVADVDEVSAGGAGAGSSTADDHLPPSSSDEALLQQVMTHFKPLSDLEWTRKMSVTQTDPSKLDAYFTVLVQSLAIGGYMDSFTAWQHRFVMPKQTIFKQRAVDTYHMKNLMVLMNLQTKVKRGKQASEAMLEILKQRSTYEKVMDLVRRVARGEKLVYEPTFAALNLEASAPKRANNTGRKKLFVQKAAMDDDSDDEDVFGAGAGAGASADEAEADAEDDDAEDEAEADEAEADEAEADEEAEADDAEADDAEADSDCSVMNMDDCTQPQLATQVPPPPPTPPMMQQVALPVLAHSAPSEDVPPPPPSPTAAAAIEKIDLFAVVPSAAPVAAAAPANSNPLRRFMAKKTMTAAPAASSASSSPVHPMMEAMAALSWEPVDVNRHSMVQLPTGACDSYMNWRKAFDADPRVENRYTEYTRPNGERSSVTNFYVRFFTVHECPLIEPAESVTTMDTRVLDTMYARWIATLTKKMSLDELRETLL